MTLASSMSDLRREYVGGALDEAQVDPDPIVQFGRWFDEAAHVGGFEPNAMTLATVSAEGQPDARIVLLKGVQDQRFRFFTNFESAKARQLAAQPAAALLFYWGPLDRQVRLRGSVERLPPDVSDAYFQSRPRGSQLGAWASKQSAVLPNRAALEDKVAEIAAAYPEGAVIPRPPHWGGYALRPDAIEFWQGRPNRLHDRLLYTRDAEGWRMCRLSA